MGSTTFNYSFTAAGNFTGPFNLTVTVATPDTNSTGLGSGYAVTAINGDVGGAAITGEVGVGGVVEMDFTTIKTYDNTIFLSDSGGSQGSSYGLDSNGLDFAIGSTHYGIYHLDGSSGLSLLYSDGSGFGGSALTLLSSNAPCYGQGTLIGTATGEAAVESLKIGDHVITLDGMAKPIKWIGHRSYAGQFVARRRDILPICINAGALGANLPRRDLFVSPLHAMFLDGVLVPAWLLVNGVSVTQADTADEIHYFHIELDRHDVILAEGAPSESFVDDSSRGLFQNALEFDALYPGSARRPAAYCAQRVEDGEHLEAIKQAINVRAGLAVHGLAQPLRGWVDALDGSFVTGWAQNPDRPEAPVCLEVLVDGVAAGRMLANLFRPGLRGSDIGSGRHAFQMALPAATEASVVEVRRVSDGRCLGVARQRQAGSAERVLPTAA